MGEALQVARDTVARFVSEHPTCFPPIVINITDGEATDVSDEELERRADVLRTVSSQDGNVLLFNIHISATCAQPILFSTTEDNLPDSYAKLLFRMSSPLPPSMVQQAQKMFEGQQRIQEGARGFAFNADLVSVIQFLDIGTRPQVDR
jgi:hypothetical protein